MSKLNQGIRDIMEKATALNGSKTIAITKLQERLNTCPRQYLLSTKKFINVINKNIEARQKLIDELKDVSILTKPERFIEITYELQEIDKKDIMASDMYSASMNEMDETI